MSDYTQDCVVILHEVGLHARPSVLLTKKARGFANSIEIAASVDGPWINAKSIVKVLALKAKQSSTLHIRSTGDGAAAAVAAIKNLIIADFKDT